MCWISVHMMCTCWVVVKLGTMEMETEMKMETEMEMEMEMEILACVSSNLLCCRVQARVC